MKTAAEITQSPRANRQFWNAHLKFSIRRHREIMESPHHPGHDWQKRYGIWVIQRYIRHRGMYYYLDESLGGPDESVYQ